MWSLILTHAIGTIKNWRIWLGIIALTFIVLTLVAARRSGAQSANLERLQDWLKYQAERAKDRAVIQSMRNSDVRDQLRKRWSSR